MQQITLDFVGKHLNGAASVLEVGPFDNPVARHLERPGLKVSYCDYLSTDELRQRAAEIPGRNPSAVPHIAYVTKAGLSAIPDKFDRLLSSHMIEHSPDLIQHFIEAQSLLNRGGSYVMVVPDKRHCFDHFFPESDFPEIIAAHMERRQRPTLRSVIEHRAFTRHDFAQSPDNPFTAPTAKTRAVAEQAKAEFEAAPYVDVHCWQFTPESLQRIISGLVAMEYLPSSTRLSTVQLGGEFGAVLTTGG